MTGAAPAPPAISVIVCTRNRPQAIGGCLRSILASPLREMELLVVDQSAGPGTGEIVAGLADDRLRYLATSTKGLARARNIGIRAARSPIVLFTDDDNFADPAWVESVLREFRDDPALDAVYGRVHPHGQGGPGQHCPTIMESLERRLVVGLSASTHEALGHGNNMAFRRECFRKHGLYHEWLGAGTFMKGGEDTDFTFRLLRRGARMVYSPDPVVYHDNWMPVAKSNQQLYGYMMSASVVFTRFFLQGSLLAGRVEMKILRGYWRDLWGSVKWRNRAGVRHNLILVRRVVLGMLFGAILAFRRPPSL